jgi:hypothetical protein
MIEAMACGTPVIAYRAGAVTEVIDEGVTGFVVESEQDAIKAVRRLGELDRRKVRARFEERFTVHRMARAYETYFPRLLLAGAQPRNSRLASNPETGRQLDRERFKGHHYHSSAPVIYSTVGPPRSECDLAAGTATTDQIQ